MQRLLNQAVWDEGGVREDLRGYVVEALGAPDGVLVFDETGDIKQGSHTVGVARQYTGVTGQVENCQVSVHAAYVSSPGAGAGRRRAVSAEGLRAGPGPLRRGRGAAGAGRACDHQGRAGGADVRPRGRRRDAVRLCRRQTRSTAAARTCAPRSSRPATATCWRSAATSGSPAIPATPPGSTHAVVEVPSLGLGTPLPGPGRERAAHPRLGLGRPGPGRLPRRLGAQPADPPRPRRRARR